MSASQGQVRLCAHHTEELRKPHKTLGSCISSVPCLSFNETPDLQAAVSERLLEERVSEHERVPSLP